MAFWATAMTLAALSLSIVPQDQVTSVDDIEVRAEASRLAQRQKVERFVEKATASPRGRPLARWRKPVCISAANFQPDYARALLDRIGLRMVQAGLDVQEEGCRPDLMIIGTTDGRALARILVEQNESGFRPSRANTDLGSAALRAFRESDRPIRWWHVSLPVSADTGEVAIRLDGEDPPHINVRDASRLRSNVRDDLSRVIILVEPARLSGIVGTALADYLAFVSIAQVDPDHEMTDYSTILNLLYEPTAYTEMTEWDQDFLAGLYSVTQPRVHAGQQSRDISNAVVRQREAAGRQEED